MKTLLTLFLVLNFSLLYAQDKSKPYDPGKDAKQQIADAVVKAKKEGKHVFLQIGGNWCSWCLMMHDFYTTNSKVDSVMQANFVVEMINYSKENRNSDVLQNWVFRKGSGFR
jgi:thioredoxin-related protein